FNNKAEKLARSEFIKLMFNTKTGFTMSQKAGEPVRIILRGPDETATDALVLTFRFFYQPGERSSFGRLSDAYQSSDIEQSIKDEFTASVNELNFFFDNSPDDFVLNFK